MMTRGLAVPSPTVAIGNDIHWVRENLQENPISNGRKTWFPVEVPLNQSNEIWEFHKESEIYWDSTPQDNKT